MKHCHMSLVAGSKRFVKRESSTAPWAGTELRSRHYHPARTTRSAALCVVFALIAALGTVRAEGGDSTSTSRPAVATSSATRDGRTITIDEAHHNFHTATGRYKPLADLLRSDGYVVAEGKEEFQPETLRKVRVLVVAHATGAHDLRSPDAHNSPFSSKECDAVRDWVRGGGSLLLVTDRPPVAAANQMLASRFGVDFAPGTVVDPANSQRDSGNGSIVFSRASGTISEHPITAGRTAHERINRVTTYAGHALNGPAGSTAILRLSSTAKAVFPDDTFVPAGGKAQAIAFQFGAGRVVVCGEAGMLTAQVNHENGAQMGINRSDQDNRQFALNIVHWLTGILK
jgi:hypothetical protein